MKEHWQAVLIGILLIVASTLSFELSVSNAKYEALSNKHAQTLKTIQSQTALVVELRKKAIPQNFKSLDELKSWVDNWTIERRPTVASILNHTFVFGGNDELYSLYYDCDDFSEAMQRDAFREGYLMSIAIVSIGSSGHAACMAEVDNAYWYIEPQTGTISSIVRRD